jgi:hypothetical protein
MSAQFAAKLEYEAQIMVRVNDGIPIQTIVQDHAWFVATDYR